MKAAELRHQGQLSQGIEMLKQVITERENFDLAFTNLALLYREGGMMPNALEVLKLGLDRIPTSYEIFLAYVSNLLKAGGYNEAIRVCEATTFRKKSYDPEIWNSLGSAYFNTGQFEKAAEAYEKAIALDEDFPVAIANLGSANLGIFLETGTPSRLEKAVDAFQRALKLDPGYAPAYNGLGVAYRQAGRLDEAIENWERALKWNPDSGDALYNLGLGYLDKGDLSRAFVYFSGYKEKFYDRLSPERKKQLDDFLIKTRK
jgi:Flp pilus assembly protein TadD